MLGAFPDLGFVTEPNEMEKLTHVGPALFRARLEPPRAAAVVAMNQKIVGRRARTTKMYLNTAIGLVAALCTTVSYYPQLKKCWQSRSAGDLSLRMFSILAVGVALWIAYGIVQSDIVIILSNSISLLMLSGILYCKLHDASRQRSAKRGSDA